MRTRARTETGYRYGERRGSAAARIRAGRGVRIRTALTILAAAAAVFFWSAGLVRQAERQREEWERSIPMANRNIEWTYAMKDGAGR